MPFHPELQDDAVYAVLLGSRWPMTPREIAHGAVQISPRTGWSPAAAVDVIAPLIRIDAVRLPGGRYQLEEDTRMHRIDAAERGGAALRPNGGASPARGVA